MPDLPQVSLWTALLFSLVSGLAGALLTVAIQARRETRRFKMDTLKMFAANRFDILGDEFTRSLNEIFVVFNDDPEVMGALQRFHAAVTDRKDPGSTNSSAADDALIRLYKAMCKAVGVKYESFNDSFFMRPFNTRPPGAVVGTGMRVAFPQPTRQPPGSHS